MGHEMKKGKPVAAGKEMGKGVGRAGNKVGQAVKKAVSPDSDRGNSEKSNRFRTKDRLPLSSPHSDCAATGGIAGLIYDLTTRNR